MKEPSTTVTGLKVACWEGNAEDVGIHQDSSGSVADEKQIC